MAKLRTRPSFELLYKIATVFPDVRVEWLIRGEGAMLKTSDAADADCREELKQLGLKHQDLEGEHERLQLSFARQARLLAALGGPGAAGE